MPDDDDLKIVEIGIVNRCVTENGQITVRNLNGAITEVYLGNHIFPVEYSEIRHSIDVLEGYYDLKVVKRINKICYYREFNVTVESVDECEPFYVYTVKKANLVFKNDTTDEQ
ncbi:Uncharacterized protein QTN25_005650 [Entamoeba marina]